MDIILETLDFKLLNLFLTLLEQSRLNQSLSDDEFLELFFKDLDNENIDDNIDGGEFKQKDILIQCYLELRKNDELINEILQEFREHFRLITKTNENVRKLILYIVLFHMDETNIDASEELIYKLSPILSLKLLSFLSSHTYKDIYDKACKYFDLEHVEQIMFGSRLSSDNVNKFKILYKKILSKKNQEDKKKYEIPATQVKPFRIHYTKSNTKNCSNESEKEDLRTYKFTAKPVPRDILYISEDTIREKEIEKMQKRQLEAQKILEDSNNKQFNCAKRLVKKKQNDPIRRENFKIEKTEFKGYANVEIKTNVTTTLREAANVIKEDENFEKFIDGLANGSLFAYQYFDDYIEERRKEAELREIENIERKRLETLITHEEAILAKRRLIEKNQIERNEFVKQWEEYEHKINELREKELIKLREVYYKNTKQRERNIQNKIQNIIDEKSQIVKEQNKKHKEEYERCIREVNEELDRKRDLIHQIRCLQEIEKINNQNRSKFDETEEPKHGLMYEMSLAQLKEKLFEMKIKIKEELERKRCEIKNDKIMKKNLLEDITKYIEDTRNSKIELRKYKKEMKTKLVKTKDTNTDLKMKLLKMKQERLQRSPIIKGY